MGHYQRAPRVGTRVRFNPNPAALGLYTKGTAPRRGTVGTVTTVSLGSCRSNHMPGPRGGLVYVDWDDYGFAGVFLVDLEKV